MFNPRFLKPQYTTKAFYLPERGCSIGSPTVHRWLNWQLTAQAQTATGPLLTRTCLCGCRSMSTFLLQYCNALLPRVRWNVCRKEGEGRFEPVEEEESLFSTHRLPTFNHRKKVNLAWKREEMPDSHNFLSYRTEILSHPDLRPMSQHQFE